MVENQLFNLEKIREITSPIGEIQGKLNNLRENFEFFKNNKDELIQDFMEEKSNEIHKINNNLTALYKDIVDKTIINTQNFLIFQNELVRKYIDSFIEDLTSLELNQDDIVYKIGLFLISNKQISKVIDKIPFVTVLSSNQWRSLLNSLEYNSIFLLILQKTEKFLEARKLKLTKNLIEKKELAEDSTQLVDEQPDVKIDKYQEYLKYSKEEFRRRRRREKRESLEAIEEKPKLQIDITKDISEKIKEFKSKLGADFNEKYLIQKDDQQDPITLIRKLKKKREEKYKEHLEKIKNKKM